MPHPATARCAVLPFWLAALVSIGCAGASAADGTDDAAGGDDRRVAGDAEAGDPTRPTGDPARPGDDAGGVGGDREPGGDHGATGGDPTATSGDAGGGGDATAAGDETRLGDAATPGGDTALPPDAPRGARWVRSHPMFISALTVSMGPPTPGFVDAYFTGFHANAAHLWANGLPAEAAGWDAARPGAPFVAWVGNDGASYAGGGLLGGQVPPLQGRIGYQVGDEPGILCDGDAACTLAALLAMGDGVAAIRAVDPEALVYLNFMNDTPTDVLAAYGALDADLVSYDHYARDDGSYEALEKFRALGLAQGRPYWRYIKSYYAESGDEPLTVSDLRWDAFSGLVYGYTGHTWFLYTISPNADLQPALFAYENDFAAPPTQAWSDVAQINVELAHLGRAVTQLTSLEVCYLAKLALLQPDGTHGWSAGAGGDPYLSAVTTPLLTDLVLGFFVDAAGERYVMVQNPAHSHGAFPTDNERTITARLAFDFAAAPPSLDRANVLSLDRLTGEVVALPLTSQGGTAELAVTLAAGDPLLLKYATGRGFALGP